MATGTKQEKVKRLLGYIKREKARCNRILRSAADTQRNYDSARVGIPDSVRRDILHSSELSQEKAFGMRLAFEVIENKLKKEFGV